MNKSSQVVTGVAVAIVAAAAGMLLSRSLQAPSATTPVLAAGTWIEPGREIPPFSLLDQDGATFGRERFENRWSLLFFGFTSCPDICPTTLAMLGGLESQLADLPADLRPQVVFVSVDPQRDTPERVAAYVKFFNPAFTGVTGTPDGIKAFTGSLYVPYAITPLEDGNYTVDHSSALFLVGPDARLRAIFSTPHEPAQLARDLRHVATLYGPPQG